MDITKHNLIACLLLMLSLNSKLEAQSKGDTLSEWDRTFMPAVQMGYVGHATDQLSGGLMVQTSIEYRHQSNLVIRFNYDDFNSNINLDYALNPDLTYSGRMSFFEVIGGIGYRGKDGKHNFSGYVQGGLRSYGYPEFTLDGSRVNLNFETSYTPIVRYSMGYEHELTSKLFLVVETLASHTFYLRDYWSDSRWSYGLTVGISAPLF